MLVKVEMIRSEATEGVILDYFISQLFSELGQSRPTAGKPRLDRRARIQFCGILNRWTK